MDCRSADLVAAALRRTGLRVHVGLIVSTPRIVSGQARRQLASSSGALAVDLESGYLAERLAGGRAIAVVRVITDTDDQPLLRLSIIRRGIVGLARLRRAAAVLPEWAESESDLTRTKGVG